MVKLKTTSSESADSSTTPFYAHAELVRIVAVALGTKKSASQNLDGIIRDQLAISIAELKQLLKDVVLDPLEQSVGAVPATIAHNVVLEYFRDYTELVRSVNADGFTREEMSEWLANSVIPEFFNELSHQIHCHFKVPGELLVHMTQPGDSALQLASNWIGSEFPEGEQAWATHSRSRLTQDGDKAGLYKYHMRDYELHAEQPLPTSQTIDRLFPISNVSKSDQQRFKVVMYLARLIDLAKRTEFGEVAVTRTYSGGPTTGFFVELQRSIAEERMARIIPRAGLQAVYTDLNKSLALETKKPAESAHSAQTLLEKAAELHRTTWAVDNPVADQSHFYKGRFSVFSGDLQKAGEHYNKALESALYTDGPLTQKIIEEGYRVAARHNGKGANDLLRHLRKAANILLLDGTGIPEQASFARKRADHVADWEKQNWKAEFDACFPPECMFPDCELPPLEVNPWFLKTAKESNGKPIDTRSPNAQQKEGAVVTRSVPKLSRAISEGDQKKFKQLLDKGADVNVSDSYGSTPLIEAMIRMNPVTNNGPVKTRYFYDVLIGKPHTTETLCALCTFKGSTALKCAIDTGEFAVVEQIINMFNKAKEASVDSTFDLEDFINQAVCVDHMVNPRYCSPLYCVLGIIGGVTRRDALPAYKQHAFRFDEVELRRIAVLLIQNGAHFDEHPVCDSSNSAFWLSIILDEAELLQEMLKHDADPAASLLDMNNATTESAIDVARRHQSSDCVETLKKRLSDFSDKQ